MKAGRVRQSGLADAARAGRSRLASWACGLGLALGASAWAQPVTAPGDAARPRLALGLIVKLKDAQTSSVVRLPASVRPSDSAQAQRMRMAAAANRKRVSFLVQKPTAFGAQVIHQGRYTTVAEAEAEAARLRLDPDVEWVAVNQMERPAAGVSFPASPATAYASHVWMQRRGDVGSGPGVAGFRTAWDRLNGASVTLSPVVVAVLDTGKLSHADLDGRTLSGYDFVSEVEFARDGNGLDADPTDPGDYLTATEYNINPSLYGSDCTAHDSSWHGTAVMSMLTPLATSSVMGPAALSMLPANIARVLPVRIGGTCGALVSDIIEGMLWAAGVDYQGSPARNPNPARVINISFGGSGNCQSSGSGDTLYRNTVSTLRTKGALVVASAGNGDGSATAQGYVGATRPASCPGVMAVTSLRYDGSKAEYANTVDGRFSASGYYGLSVAGGDASASPNQTLNLLSDIGPTTAQGIALESNIGYVSEGTSFAAPQVAAVAALVLTVAPALSVDDLANLLLDSASPHTTTAAPACSLAGATVGHCSCTTAACGRGVLDADAALSAAITMVGLVPTLANTFSSPEVSATYFVPNRLRTSSSSSSGGGGGGGAADELSLLALLAAVLGLAWWRWRAEASVLRSGRR